MIDKKLISSFENNEAEVIFAMKSDLESNRQALERIANEKERLNFVIKIFIESMSKFPENASGQIKRMLYGHITQGAKSSELIMGLETYYVDAKNKLDLDKEENFDARYGTCTAPIISHHDLQKFETVDEYRLANSTRYYPCPVNVTNTILRKLEHHGCNYEDYIFADIGSGMGRNLLLASSYPFKQIIGVEISTKLHEIAMSNIKIYKEEKQQCKNFELVNIDALHFDFPKTNMILFFWEPFSETISNPFIKRLEQSISLYPRKVILTFCDSVFNAVLESKVFARKEVAEVYDFLEEGKGDTTKASIFTNF